MWKPPVNFVNLHYAYILSLGILGLVILYPHGNLRAIDAYFFGVSASTESGLNTATLESIRRRNDLVYQFLKKTKLSQITKDVAGNNSDRANARSCDGTDKLSEEQSSEKQERKRRRHDDTVDDGLPSKRSRYNGQGSSFSARHTPHAPNAIPTRRPQVFRTAASRSASGKELTRGKPGLISGERRDVRSNLSTLNSSLPRKNNVPGVPPGPEIPNRHSARIAEREERLSAAVVAPSDTVRIPRQKTAKPAQAPTHPASTVSQERKSTPEQQRHQREAAQVEVTGATRQGRRGYRREEVDLVHGHQVAEQANNCIDHRGHAKHKSGRSLSGIVVA
ncbi:hypothetical protein DL98DRAFT_577490 [Cadophora sp. DSE1049]|nr:hypothetical protein DL98DRAFT_577490 [Cadophora sp. DSE1049]